MSENEPSTSNNDGSELPLKKRRHLLKIHGSYLPSQLMDECDDDGQCCSRNNRPEGNNQLTKHLSLMEWHTQQMVKALFDNTVNSVIEDMGTPLPDFYNIINNEGNVEDEAVRMAIRSHGLQKQCSCPTNAPHLPISANIPFHQRKNLKLESGPSKSLKPPLEADFLSEAVSIAIQKKGLGASLSNTL